MTQPSCSPPMRRPWSPSQVQKGIHVSPSPVLHREDEYDSRGFHLLRQMQAEHFWYRGRHRFLLEGVRRQLNRVRPRAEGYSVLDLGGGCGGWLAYLLERLWFPVAEVALADSSLEALTCADECLPPTVSRYQADIFDLPWRNHWDVIFLLDVLEHVPADCEALLRIRETLAPGGLLFVTTPALQLFWTHNDALVGHQRRYARRDFHQLAAATGLELLDCRYFMFLLSPLLLASRFLQALKRLWQKTSDPWQEIERSHRLPHPLLGKLLTTIFAAETPLGHWLPFPWGTSILAVLRRPT